MVVTTVAGWRAKEIALRKKKMTDFKALKKRYEKVFLDALEKLAELDQKYDSETRLELKCLVKDKVLYWKIDYSELEMQIHNEHIDIIPKWHLELEKEIEIAQHKGIRLKTEK